MRIAAVITEYNPFHNGHKYHIEKTRELTEADYIIAVMSGNYVQRGTPAILDKYTRTKMALLNGVDLVLELPLPYATGSAEFFADGAVSLLDSLGIINALCFGSELGTIEPFFTVAKTLVEEPDIYREKLKESLKAGNSFPLARKNALLSYYNTNKKLPDNLVLDSFLNEPNNILGIEYCKSMVRRQCSFIPITIKRAGNEYHDDSLSTAFSSATAIRKIIETGGELNQLNLQMPLSAYELLLNTFGIYGPVTQEDFSLLLKYQLMSESADSLTRYLDVSPELSARICRKLNNFSGFSSFTEILKTKDMTYTRISRALLHILLQLADEHLPKDAPYARILGFRKQSGPLLHYMKEHCRIPLITKAADAASILPREQQVCFEKEVWASNLYESAAALKFKRTFCHELSQEVIRL